MADWREAIAEEWRRRQTDSGDAFFPLIAQSFDHAEIVAMVDTLLSGRITMGERVREFEARFAEAVGARFAVMVNSGSSANLLAVTAAANPERRRHVEPGDEVVVPAVCWSTSVWPAVQLGLRPVFADVDPRTLNLDVADAARRVTSKTRAVMAVHVLGNSAPMWELLRLCRERELLLIEDACEALGSTADGRQLGTLGELGTYSFYYSHHITTGEGGMVVAHTQEDADLLRCLRAHGWSRDVSNRADLERANPSIDPRFLFVNVGFNLRPLEVQGAMGLLQLARLERLNRSRVENSNRLRAALVGHPRWRGQLEFPEAAPGTLPAWFGFPCLLAPGGPPNRKRAFLRHLGERGVENRPIISGNFARQPALRRFGIRCDPADFPGAEAVNERGFFIGLHTNPLPPQTVERLTEIILSFDG